MKCFITYSHLDKEFVNQLVKDLEYSGRLDVMIDHKALKSGDSFLNIFEEIGTSDFLIPILSENSVESNWVKKEISVAITKEITEDSFKVIPIIKQGANWKKLEEKLPLGLKEALRDKLRIRFDNQPYEDAFKMLLKACSQSPNPESIYSKIQGPKSDNPFRRVRAEYFEDVNILARSFTKPEQAQYNSIIEVKPTLIEGGRGSGKTMILKSLQAQIAIKRQNGKSYSETGLTYFGVYCRLSRWSFETFSEAGELLEIFGNDVASQLFQTEFYLHLTQALVDEIQMCADEKYLEINSSQERTVSSEIAYIIKPNIDEKDKTQNFNDVKYMIKNELRNISDYIFHKKLKDNVNYIGPILRRGELQDICNSIIKNIDGFSNITIYFLLDEYENLLPFQNVIVNTLIKWSYAGKFSVKAVAKKAGFQDPRTLEGQEIERPDDYTHVDLDYDISDKSMRQNYKRLLIEICNKILKAEGFKETDISKLLEEPRPLNESDKKIIENRIIEIVSEQGKVWDKLSDKERKEYWHRLEVGAFYNKFSGRKDFAGIDNFILLSSGIIRYFLELCGTSYYFALQDNINFEKGDKISVEAQTNAAHILSKYHLGELKRNIVNYGNNIHQFAIDIGDIFRRKLVNHLSEPEAARIRIIDPNRLYTEDFKETREIIDLAEMHSVLQSREGRGGMRPKHATDIQPVEYLLNRIYAPVLQFSPRPRWGTEFTCQDIKSLLDSNERKKTKSKLIKKVTPEKNMKDETIKSIFDY